MDCNNVKYENGKIVSEYSEEELDAQISSLEATIARLQTSLTDLQAIKDSIV